jgi:uncharacterized protein with FMN-binding domain
MIGWVITLTIVAGLVVAGRIGWANLEKEHREARSLPLNAVDFNTLNDGSYHGAYAGGMYKWRANECQVTVSSGKVASIQPILLKEPENQRVQQEVEHRKMLYDRVVQAQSLQVDAISGATLTSKAYLQAVENALVQAQYS